MLPHFWHELLHFVLCEEVTTVSLDLGEELGRLGLIARVVMESHRCRCTLQSILRETEHKGCMQQPEEGRESSNTKFKLHNRATLRCYQ